MLINMSIRKTAKQKTETPTAVVIERLAARFHTIPACNQPLDFKRTRECPVFKIQAKCRCLRVRGRRAVSEYLLAKWLFNTITLNGSFFRNPRA